jgi:CheY-like chemotaxis protein
MPKPANTTTPNQLRKASQRWFLAAVTLSLALCLSITWLHFQQDAIIQNTTLNVHRAQEARIDLRLPKVDGLQVLQEIKSDPSLKHLPTVILTTSAAEADRVAAYDGGAGSFLVKPVDFQKFTSLLETFGYYWIAWNRHPERQT